MQGKSGFPDLVQTPLWAAQSELRRAGVGEAEISLEDVPRVWTYGCLTAHTSDLGRVRDRLLRVWEELPDERYRSCGNGRLLRAFLDATVDLAQPDWPALLALRLPRTRPA